MSMHSLSDYLKVERNPQQEAKFKQRMQKIYQDEDIKAFLSKHQSEITEEMIQKSLSKLDEFLKEKELHQAGLPGANPGFIPKLFLNEGYIDVNYEPSAAYLHAQKAARQQRKLKNLMVPQAARHARLSDIYHHTAVRQQVLSELVHFLEQVQSQGIQDIRGFYLTGTFGVGKTYMLSALANELMVMDYQVFIVHFPTFVNDLKGSFADNTMTQQIDQLKQVDVLIIDDIGAQFNSAWSRDDILMPILEYRMREGKPTCFTSNFTMKELEEHLAHSKDGHEPVKARRILERINYLAKEMILSGENLRAKERERG